MENSNKKRLWFIVIFSALLIAASLFVWWMSSSNFKGSYKEIKQQYYSVVAGQVVSELEASIKYGKSLDSFYNIDGIFNKLTSLLPNHIKVAITNNKGEVLYTSVKKAEEVNEVTTVLQNQKVVEKIKNMNSVQYYAAIEQENYDIMILPMKDKSDAVIGNLVLVYPTAALSAELQPKQMETLKYTLMVLAVALLVLILYLFFVPTSEEEEGDKRRQFLVKVVPALIVMFCIGAQSLSMYDQYRDKYKSALTDSAGGILVYIGSSVSSMHQRGISYEKMNGLKEYLSTKAKDTPIIWNIRVYNTIADTGEVLEREDTWRIRAPLIQKAKEINTQVEIQISQKYIDKQMTNMMLVFLATIIIAAVIVFEATRLPDLIMFRRSQHYNSDTEVQDEKVSSGLRIGSFIFYMAVYASLPFSAILIRNWELQLFGLSTDLTASIPMTFELLSLMLCSMLFAKFFSKADNRVFLTISIAVLIVGNILSALASGPVSLILYRILCGAGFAGIKNVVNSIIGSAKEGSQRTRLHIAAMNAGLLGGIMCGGSLGAVIADSISTSFTYVFTAGTMLVFALIALYIFPWKVMKEKSKVKTAEKLALPIERQKMRITGDVIKYLVMVTLPFNLGLMFIVAFIPGYVQKLDLPVILVSYGYLVNGILGIYLGPLLARKLTLKLGRTRSVSLMLFMGAASILVLSIQPTIGLILLSTALMGIFDGFGSPVSTDFFLEMPEVKNKVEVPISLAFLGVTGNAIQMLSPMIYGWLLVLATVTGVNTLLVLGLVYMVFALFILTLDQKKNDNNINSLKA